VYFQGWLAFSAKQDELFTPSCYPSFISFFSPQSQLGVIFSPQSQQGVSKKIKKPIKPRKSKKIIKKSNRKKNRLEKLKNKPVRFAFGFKRLKPNKPNRTEPVQIKKSIVL